MLLINRKGKKVATTQDGNAYTVLDIKDDATDTSDNDIKEEIKTIEPTFVEAIKDYRTIQLWLLILCSSSFPYYIANNFKSYEQRDINDDKFITIVGSIGAIFNGLSRSFWSSLQDIIGFKKVYISLLILEIAVAFTFVAIHKVKILYLIWV